MSTKRFPVVLFWVLLVILVGGAYSVYAQGRVTGSPAKKAVKVYGAARRADFENIPQSLVPADMSEGFEGTWPAAGWVVVDTSDDDGGEYLFGKRNCHPRTGSYGGWSVGGGAQGSQLDCFADYPNYANTWAVYGPFDLTGASSASLTFYLWGQAEYNASCLYDYLYAGSSVDGSSFSNGVFYCGDWTGGGAGNGYYQETIDLSSRLGASQVWVGFALISDFSETYQGFTLDDLTLTINGVPTTQTPTPTQSPTPTHTTAPATATPTQSCTPTATPTGGTTPSERTFLPLVSKRYPPGPTPTPTTPGPTTPSVATVTPTPTATPTATPSPTGFALPTYFPAVGDAFVSQNAPGSNFGNPIYIAVGSLNGGTFRGLVKFDLSAIPVGTHIDQATLSMNYFGGNAYGTTFTITAYRAGAGWDELTVTWNSQPPSAEAYGAAVFSSFGWQSFDVTDLVQAWVDGTYPNQGIMLRGHETGNQFVWFYARENGSSIPGITISYSP
jgi:hypothetical protein